MISKILILIGLVSCATQSKDIPNDRVTIASSNMNYRITPNVYVIPDLKTKVKQTYPVDLGSANEAWFGNFGPFKCSYRVNEQPIAFAVVLICETNDGFVSVYNSCLKNQIGDVFTDELNRDDRTAIMSRHIGDGELKTIEVGISCD